MLTSIALLAGIMADVPVVIGVHADPQPVELSRKFKPKEISTYDVDAKATVEIRPYGLNTFIPLTEGVQFRFTTEVISVTNDGFAQVLYKRPTMTFLETDLQKGIVRENKMNSDLRFLMTVSPINEITNIRDLNPSDAGDDQIERMARLLLQGERRSPEEQRREAIESRLQVINSILGPFMNSFTRLTLFVEGITGIDFSPKLPFDEVVPGDTWQRTVDYAPQQLSGTDKSAVQRLDMTYTYMGRQKNAEGKEIERIEAVLEAETNAADYLNQLFRLDAQRTGIERVDLKLRTVVKFDLDPATHQTLFVEADGNSSVSVMLNKKLSENPVLERRTRGRTTMRLVSNK
jgi:hypothetical protein